MESEWPIEKLEELADLIVDCPHSTPTWTTGGEIVLRSQNIRNGRLDLTSTSFTDSGGYLSRVKRAIPTAGDLILTREAPMGEVCLIPVGLKCCMGQRMVLIRTMKDRLVSQYLLYLFQSPYLQHQIGWNEGTGTTVSNIRIPNIKSFLIPLPPLPEQRAIAHILGSLDDKIELNRQMNATLEGMAQALFKSWFVDFDPVIDNALAAGNPIPEELADRAEVRRAALADGTANREAAKPFPAGFQHTEELGWIPAGWSVGSILNQAKLLSGGTPKTSESTYWNGSIKWASAKDVSQCGKAFLIETERTITQEGLDKSSTKIIPKFSTVIVSRGATTGRMAMFADDIAMNQTCYALRVNSGHHFYGYCHAVNFIASIVLTAHGSVFDTITTKTFESSNVVLASGGASGIFENAAQSLFEKVLANELATQSLTKLRDTLLPKLISGELRIPDAEKLVEEALA